MIYVFVVFVLFAIVLVNVYKLFFYKTRFLNVFTAPWRVRLAVYPSVHLSMTLRYCDHRLEFYNINNITAD